MGSPAGKQAAWDALRPGCRRTPRRLQLMPHALPPPRLPPTTAAHHPPPPPQGDVKGEGGLDDATGTNKFGGGASMRQTSSVVDLTSIKEEDDEEKVRVGERGCWRGRTMGWRVARGAGEGTASERPVPSLPRVRGQSYPQC